MEEPSPRTSRRTLAGALAAALALAGGGFLLGRGTGPVPEAEPSNPDEAAQPIFPAWSGPLLRQDLVDLAALAADTTASGMAPDEDLVQSEGQRFEIRLPFGCGGPALQPSSSGWTFDESNGTLRVFVTPETWSSGDWRLPANGGAEAIEGFWIDRPWTSSEACPPASGDVAAEDPQRDEETPGDEISEEPDEPGNGASQPLPRTLAIGQVYTLESQRSGRSGGQPFSTVVRIAADDLDTSQGFRLRLSGRLSRSAGPAPAICHQDEAEFQPVCLVTVSLDEVAIENPASGETLAIWTLGQRGSADPGG
jgi:hypothetical protein